MTVDLKWILILSMVLAVLGFLGGAGSQFTDLGLSPVQVKAGWRCSYRMQSTPN